MVALAFYDCVLYGTRNVANEAVYAINTTTFVATVFIDYVDADYDFGGLGVDPNTGEFYGTNDDLTPFDRGLFRINMDGTGTLIAPYPDSQTDIDGLAVSNDGFAYLVIDEPGSIYVYDFGGSAYVTPLTNPWTTSEVFCGGAWIYEASGAFFDDFDSYTAGVQLVAQNNVDWDTWSGGGGTGEDPFVSNAFSFSGSNTVVIAQNNDLIRYHGQLTSGKWYISFFLYIPTGQSGYFNSMSGFTPNPFQWAHEVYFDVGGAGRLIGVPGAPIAFTWAENTWQQAMVVVDLDLDLAEFWFGDSDPLTMVHSWQWTQGGTVNLQLDVTDFFGAAATEEMYVDNYYFGDVMPPIVPVALSSFTADVNNGVVELNWATATETNNNGFAIDRKSTNSEYTQIGFVPGFGTTTEPRSYSFTDNSVTPAVYSYRLKQVDYDGTFKYSDVVEVDVLAPAVFALDQNYPNPFNPRTIINFRLAADSKVILKVFDVLGQEVATLINSDIVAGSHNVDFKAANINSGVYFYRIDATGIDGTNFSSVKKMILTK
jgi:energy-converting hydrogenase Eha subunit F